MAKKTELKRKPIQVSVDVWLVLNVEAGLQTAKEGRRVTLGEVLAKYALALHRKHRRLENKRLAYEKQRKREQGNKM